MLFISNFMLLAQTNKTDSATSVKKNTGQNTGTPNKADTVITEKAQSKPVIQNNAAIPTETSPVNSNKPDNNVNTLKDTSKFHTPQNKINPLVSAKKDSVQTQEKKDTSKSTTKKSQTEVSAKAKKNSLKLFGKKDKDKNEPAEIGLDTMAIDSTTRLLSDSIRVKNYNRHTSLNNARPYPLPEPNPNSVKFYHRYWRDIDLQDVKNKKILTYHPQLITGLLEAIKNNQIKAYSPVGGVPENPTGDAFTVRIPYNQLMAGLSDTALVDDFDKDGNKIGSKQVPNPFTPEKISGYRIKEDVYLDKTRSKIVTRIIGIAPLVKLTLSSGEVISIQPLCWIKFKECRNVLVTIDVDPTKKVGDSMDDVFLQRRFYGKIIQESNAEGSRIKDYKTDPADQLTEANRIEQKLTNFKKGSWEYTMLNESPESSKPASRPKKVKVKPPSIK